MGKVRKGKGIPLRKGETYKKDRDLFRYSYTDQFGKRRSVYAKDIKTLREKEKNISVDLAEGMVMYDPDMATVNEGFDRYVSIRTDWKPTTRAHYKSLYNRYARDGFGKKKIKDVRYSDVMAFYLALVRKGISVGTIDVMNRVISAVFNLAIRDMLIRNNPTDKVIVELRRRYGGSKRKHALTVEQEKKFLEFIEDERFDKWRNIFIVLFGTGMRISELVGLRWEDVDLEKNLISVNHQVLRISKSEDDIGGEGFFYVDRPKTEAGIREIPLFNKVRRALIAEKEFQEKTGLHNTIELDGMSGFVFCNNKGSFLTDSHLNSKIYEIVDECNANEIARCEGTDEEPLLIPKFSCHIARHSFCSRLCEIDTNIKVTQSVMGHQSSKTTLDIYAEVSEQKKQETFRNINEDDVI